MARNDVVLLDSIIEKTRASFRTELDDSEVFELFCFDQLLKDYDFSYEELESGWTDGPDDGGVDGFFSIIDGKLATQDCRWGHEKKPPHRCGAVYRTAF